MLVKKSAGLHLSETKRAWGVPHVDGSGELERMSPGIWLRCQCQTVTPSLSSVTVRGKGSDKSALRQLTVARGMSTH